MRQGWEVNSLAATTSPAQAPAALSRLQAAASRLASTTAETWQTQPVFSVHRVSPRDPCSVPQCPDLLLPPALSPPALGIGHMAQLGRGFVSAWVPVGALSHNGDGEVGLGAISGVCSPLHGQAWWGMARHSMAGLSATVLPGHGRSIMVLCEGYPCPTSGVSSPQ